MQHGRYIDAANRKQLSALYLLAIEFFGVKTLQRDGFLIDACSFPWESLKKNRKKFGVYCGNKYLCTAF